MVPRRPDDHRTRREPPGVGQDLPSQGGHAHRGCGWCRLVGDSGGPDAVPDAGGGPPPARLRWPGRSLTARARSSLTLRSRRPITLAPGRSRKRSTYPRHGRRSRRADTSNEAAASEQLNVVEVGHGVEADAVARTYLHLGRESPDGGGDGRHDDRVEKSSHRISGEHDHRPELVERCQPDLTSSWSGIGHAGSAGYSDSQSVSSARADRSASEARWSSPSLGGMRP